MNNLTGEIYILKGVEQTRQKQVTLWAKHSL